MELLIPDWSLPQGVHIAFTTRRQSPLLQSRQVSMPPYDAANLGFHVGDDASSVTANRARLWRSLPGVRQIQWLNQTHGTDSVPAAGARVRLNADACYTRDSGIACAILTADCLPVLLCDDSARWIAAAHAGWRGLANGVLEKTLESYSGKPEHLSAYLGPCIGPEAFEVGAEVKDAFCAASPIDSADSAHCFRQGEGERWWANLPALARWRLHQAGVRRVYWSGLCTYQDAHRFYSYRRACHQGDARTGRQASLIWRTSDH
jgi:YfiH family protein